MANKDGTGPLGQGPLTGRGFGPCSRGCGFRRGFGRVQPLNLTKEQERKILEAELVEIDAEKAEIEKQLKGKN